MICYEVNLEVDSDIYFKYLDWLRVHTKEMLSIEGFQSAKIWEDVENINNYKKKITVTYFLKDHNSLDSYLEHHAERMRKQGEDKFSGKFSANRRVLTEL